MFAAAVADWRPALAAGQKIKKDGDAPPALELVENPDILRAIAQAGERGRGWSSASPPRPSSVVAHARAKLARKGCDWIVANDVSPAAGTFGGDRNQVTLIRRDGAVEAWPRMSKQAVAPSPGRRDRRRELGHG